MNTPRRPEILELTPANRAEAVRRAAAVLKRGGVVAFPTETVYGLGCALGEVEARARIQEMKRQPPQKPFQILVGSLEEAGRLSRPGRVARKLMRSFWPGPLTLVLPDASGTETVGLRLPDHPVTRALLRETGLPLLATSANLHGEDPAASGAEVAELFGGKVDLVLDGGPPESGRSSTVVDLSEPARAPKILRRGGIGQDELIAAARLGVLVAAEEGRSAGAMAAVMLRQMLPERRAGSIVRLGVPPLSSALAEPLCERAADTLREMGYLFGPPEIVHLHARAFDAADEVVLVSEARRAEIEETWPHLQGHIHLLAAAGAEVPPRPEAGLAVGPGYAELAVALEKEIWTLCRNLEADPAPSP